MLEPIGIPPTEDLVTYEELQLATRNRGMPLEALRYDTTPPGLHYLLTHYDIPFIEPSTWRLTIGGAVSNPLTLSLEDLRAMPPVTMPVTMECAGNGRARLRPRPVSNPWLHEAIGTAVWTGTRLRDVLAAVGVQPDAVEWLFTGADHGTERTIEQDYQRSLPLDDADAPEVMLAYEMDGAPLPPQHGAPCRLLVPGWYGMTSVKWLTGIEAITTPFEGYQMAIAYRYRTSREDPGEPIRRQRVRSLLVPPGFPDYLTRRRILDAGPTDLFGRAWSGEAAIERVEIGIDEEWFDAKLEEPVGAFAWRGFRAMWEATPGDYVVACRATDAAGNVQPLQEPWNYGGFGNNAVQRVPVTVR